MTDTDNTPTTLEGWRERAAEFARVALANGAATVAAESKMKARVDELLAANSALVEERQRLKGQLALANQAGGQMAAGFQAIQHETGLLRKAVEFGHYLSRSAETFKAADNAYYAELGRCQEANATLPADVINARSDAWRALRSAAYEFDKRAAAAGFQATPGAPEIPADPPEDSELAELRRVLADVEHRFACVLEKATGGAMSKANYSWEVMRAAIDDFLTRERNEAFEEGVGERKAEDEPGEVEFLSEKLAAAYQIIGALARITETDDTNDVQNALEYLSDDAILTEILPWPKDPDALRHSGFADRVDGLTADLDSALDKLLRLINGEIRPDAAADWLVANYKDFKGRTKPTPVPMVQSPARAVRHRKSGGIYAEVGRGLLQTVDPLVEDDPVVIYQGRDGRFWVRPVSEFDDGRFEPAPEWNDMPPPPGALELAERLQRSRAEMAEGVILKLKAVIPPEPRLREAPLDRSRMTEAARQILYSKS